MSQLGKINKNDWSLLLHVKAKDFDDITEHDLVDEVYFLDELPESKKAEIKEKYIGKKYGEIK